MANKINGIDVSECGYYNNGKCDNPNGMACNCINNAVCYFKELKRLQEENKELKKRQITKNGFICDCEQNAKYKQALEEIKNEIGDLKDINKLINLQKILDKINEALNDRD